MQAGRRSPETPAACLFLRRKVPLLKMKLGPRGLFPSGFLTCQNCLPQGSRGCSRPAEFEPLWSAQQPRRPGSGPGGGGTRAGESHRPPRPSAAPWSWAPGRPSAGRLPLAGPLPARWNSCDRCSLPSCCPGVCLCGALDAWGAWKQSCPPGPAPASLPSQGSLLRRPSDTRGTHRRRMRRRMRTLASLLFQNPSLQR